MGNLNPPATAESVGLGNVPNVDCTNADNITSGTLDIARIPALAYQNTVTVADQAARFALTIAQVQNGDSVFQVDTEQLYLVVDDAQLNNAAGYLAYVMNVDWAAVSNKPQPVLDLTGVNTGNETAQSVGNIISGAATKPTPVDGDGLGLQDSQNGNILKKLTLGTLKTFLKTYFDTLYPSGSGTSTGTNTGDDKTGIIGLLKGAAGNIVAAVAGVDYLAPNAPITGATKTKVTYDASGRITAGADATTADIADSLNRRYCTDAKKTVIANTSGTNTGDDKTGIVGMLKGLAGNIVAAVSGVDYAPATSGSSVLKGNGAGGFSSAVANTDFLPATTGAAMQKANGSGGLTAATANSDFLPATTGSAIQKASGAGGLTAAVPDVDYQTPVTNTSTGTLLNGATDKATPVDADIVGLGDSTAGFIQRKLTWANIKATLKTYFDTLYTPLVTSVNFTTTSSYNITNTAYTPVNAAVRIAPAAGKYIVMASAVMRTGNQQIDAYLGLFAGTDGATVLQSGAESFTECRRDVPLSVSVNLQIPVTVFAFVTVTAGQIIELKTKSSSGSVSVQHPNITAFKVS